LLIAGFLEFRDGIYEGWLDIEYRIIRAKQHVNQWVYGNMKVAVLRLSSRTNSPESAVDTIGVAYDSMWHAGEKTLAGAIRDDSGVSFVVSDAASVRQLKEDIREFFQTRREKLLFHRKRFEGKGVSGTVNASQKEKRRQWEPSNIMSS